MTKSLTQEEAIELLKKFQEEKKMNLTEFAKFLGVSKHYLSNVYGKRQKPGKKVLFEKSDQTVFVPIGVLDDFVHS